MSLVEGARVAITGGCGFIGSHLVRGVLQAGARSVAVLDSLKYGTPAAVEGLANVEVIRTRLGVDPAEVLAGHLAGAAALFHLAAEKHNASRDDPQEVIAANVAGTQALFDAAARAGVRKIVYASSLYAYGRLQGPPMVESEVPRPATVYGMSKLAGEHLLAHIGQRAGVGGVALRFFFVYGPGQYQGAGYKSVIVGNFERLRRGEAPRVFGDGRQALDYVYVDDVVAAALQAMDGPVSGEVLNVGSARALEIRDLTAAMIRVAGARVEPVHDPPDWTAGSCRVADTSRIRSVLGWTPKTSLEDGLARTWRWIAER